MLEASGRKNSNLARPEQDFLKQPQISNFGQISAQPHDDTVFPQVRGRTNGNTSIPHVEDRWDFTFPVCSPRREIMRAKVNFVCGTDIREAVVGLDTCSNQTIVAINYGDLDPKKQAQSVTADVCGGTARLGPALTFKLARANGLTIAGPFPGSLGHNGANGLIPRGCMALFSMGLIKELKVDLNWHRDYHGVDVPWLHVTKENPTAHQVFVSEAKVRTYLQRKDKEKVSKEAEPPLPEWRKVKLSPARSPWFINRILEILEKHKAYFVPPDQLPPPMAGGKHSFQFKKDAQPVACREPRWTPYRAEYIDAWAEKGLAMGLLELAPFSKSVSRVHLADKPPDGIRPCGDYVNVNDTIEKIAPEVPYLQGQVLSFQDAKMFLKSDAPMAFHMIELDEKSRDATTVWTRKYGKVRFTRLNFGHKNASTVLQTRLSRSMQSLPARSRSSMKNYADDFCGGKDDEKSLVELVEDFFDYVVIPNNLSLKAAKTEIGFDSVVYGGYQLGSGRRSLALKHVAPILDMEPPTDIHELRRVLGLFVQSKSMIADYATVVRPLTRLTGKVPWTWGEKENEAFLFMKAAIARRPALHNPDYSRPFYVDVDSSEAGCGGALYQVQNEEESMKTEHKQFVLYVSEAWKGAMLDRPIYYKEGRGLIVVLSKCRLIIEASPFTTVVRTDHMPLRWIKYARKGPLAGWRIEELTGLDYRVEYISGTKNPTADALSRWPVISHNVPTEEGLDAMLMALLDTLSGEFKDSASMWLWMERDTAILARTVQVWRTNRTSLVKTAPKPSSMSAQWEVAIIAPSAERAPVVCAQLFGTGRPFACLVPSELVSWIPSAGSNKDELKTGVSHARKMAFLAAGFTWIINETNGSADRVYAIEALGNLSSWIKEQKENESELKTESDQLVTAHDGLMMHAPPGEKALVLVPSGRRKALALKAHQDSQHRGWKKVLADLRQTYYWRHMSKDVRQWVLECVQCLLAKRKRNLSPWPILRARSDWPEASVVT